MARTFCNDALSLRFRHRVTTEIGHYVMSGSWIDVASPCDMMDYDFTMPIADLRALHEKLRLEHIALQARP